MSLLSTLGVTTSYISPKFQIWAWAGLSVAILAPLLTTFLGSLPAPQVFTQTSHSLAALPPSSQARKLYPEDIYPGGQYVELPMGRVRFYVFGPEGGRKVVFIHGLSIPSPVWKDVAPYLAEQGFQVMLFDLYGRGYSDAPHTQYTGTLYATQLALLMQYVGWAKARVVGLSMGGAIATIFAAQFPHLVDGKVALLASAGLVRTEEIPYSTRLIANLTQWHWLGGILKGAALNRARTSPVRGKVESDLEKLIKAQTIALPLYTQAMLSSLLHGPLREHHEMFKKVAMNQAIDVLLIWGTKDQVVAPKYAEEAKRIIPRAELVWVEGADHDFTTSHPTEIRAALMKFL